MRDVCEYVRACMCVCLHSPTFLIMELSMKSSLSGSRAAKIGSVLYLGPVTLMSM